MMRSGCWLAMATMDFVAVAGEELQEEARDTDVGVVMELCEGGDQSDEREGVMAEVTLEESIESRREKPLGVPGAGG